jgi:hypothetical protein
VVRTISGYVRTIAAVGLFAAVAQGALLLDTGTTALTVSDPTQLGRISRNNVISDWSTVKAFPGEVNLATTYHYHVYDIPILVFPFIQITIDSGQNLFASAYLDSYNPASKSTNYLGDAGSSGNFFGLDPIAFQVIAGVGHHLIVVVNNTGAADLGVGDPFSILVEGFSDTQFNENTPEPASVIMSGSGLAAGLFFAIRRKMKARAQA